MPILRHIELLSRLKNFFSGGIGVTTLGCSDANAVAGCKTEALVNKICNCVGALCNKYNSAGVSVSTPMMTAFVLIISGFTFVF